MAIADSVATMAGGQAVVDLALKEFGDLNILVCCAGILRERMIFNMSEDEWDAVIAVHLKGHFTVMQPATAPHAREEGRQHHHLHLHRRPRGQPGPAQLLGGQGRHRRLTRSMALGMAKYGVR